MKKNLYIFCFLIFIMIITVTFLSCDSSVQYISHVTENQTMWPQYGYSARRTGNPYGPKQNINPINGSITQWIDTLPRGYNAVYPVIDSKGNIYYLHVHSDYITATIYKINPKGKIEWQLTDSNMVPSFGNGMGLSADEKSIYIPCYSGIFCIDVSGYKRWEYIDYSIYSNTTMPAIGKDGTIYSVIGPYYLQAVSPDGYLKWIAPNAIGAPSLDNNGNIYVGWTDGLFGGHNFGIAKYDKSGNLKWKYDLLKPPLGISIDVNDNIYLQCGNTLGTGLYSFNSEGSLRWAKIFNLGDSISFNFSVTPLISNDNEIYTSAIWFLQGFPWRSIVKLDTMGNEFFRTPVSIYGSYVSYFDELFFDSNENIYFKSDFEYGSLNQNGNIRFIENKQISSFTLSIGGNLILTLYDETSNGTNSLIVNVK